MKNPLSRRNAVLKGALVTGAGLVGVALLGARKASAQTAGDDLAVLKALLTAERNAIKTYEAGKGVLDAATSSDPLFAYQGVVTAIALHFRQQHLDHADVLVKYLTSQGGVDDVGPGAAQIPAGFVGNIKNVVDLATNAEKGAAIAYTDVQKQLKLSKNAALASAVGATETQHFVVLQLVARGFVVPAAASQNATAAAMAGIAAKLSPKSFVVGVEGGTSALTDEATLPFYDVTR